MMAFKSGDMQLIYLIVGNPDIARQINEGEVKGLLVPGLEALHLVPDVPTFARVGIVARPDRIQAWFGMFAPKGTPKDIVKKLNAEISAIMANAGIRRAVSDLERVRAGGDSSEAFAKFMVGSDEGQLPRRHFRRQAGAMTEITATE